MAYGGHKPTPTDALFVLGKAREGNREKAVEGITTIANDLGVSVEEAAKMIFDQTCQEILTSATKMVEQINSKPVYTIKELLKGHQVKPTHVLVLGGPASYFAEHLAKCSGYTVAKVPAWSVANAIGAALARTTCEVTLFADTQKGIVIAPEESFSQPVKPNFTKKEALALGFEILKQKARKLGADMSDLEIDVLEDLEFNMVRSFRLTGKNIRIKLQVKPGLSRGYKAITDKISANAAFL